VFTSVSSSAGWLLIHLQGTNFLEALQSEVSPGDATGDTLTPPQLTAAVQGCAKQLMQGYDKEQGGFGGPPKFPRPAELNLMLRAAHAAKVRYELYSGVCCLHCLLCCTRCWQPAHIMPSIWCPIRCHLHHCNAIDVAVVATGALPCSHTHTPGE
jgi:hypothetical protein